jgi:hypothetical protein
MKTVDLNKRASETVIYSFLVCVGWAASSYFFFGGKYLELSLKMAIIAFIFTCILIAIRTSSIDNFYLPPVEVHISNKRWERCIEWWNSLPEDELARNIRKLKAMNRRNAYILLRAFEHLELFEKCSIIKRAIS